MIKNLFYALSFFLNPFIIALSDSIDYYNPNFIENKNKVYSPLIKSVMLKPNWNQGGVFAAIPLNASHASLLLLFDDLCAYPQQKEDILRPKNYYYTLIHCDKNWQTSNLQAFDYIDGFTENTIDNYEYSINTNIKYLHYSLQIPNQYTSITKSGNYILFIYEDTPSNPIITQQFIVYENKIAVNSNLIPPTNAYQNIDIKLQTESLAIKNPVEELTLCILQNGRWDNGAYNIKPSFINPSELIYYQNSQTLFTNSSKYHNFDSRNLLIPKQTSLDSIYLNLPIDDTEPKKKQQFGISYNLQQLNELFYTQNFNSIYNNDLDANYIWVHFTLALNTPINYGNLFVFGEFTQWQTTTENQLYFNYQKKCYEASILLKQGYYEYKYVIEKDNKLNIDEITLENDQYNTQNSYSILVYQRGFTDRYDKIIAYKPINVNK